MRYLIILAASILSTGPALAQSPPYPAKPVRVVVPWPPGGGNDIAGRTVMQRVAESTGQTFPIDNRGGAGGQTRAVTRGPLAGWERP